MALTCVLSGLEIPKGKENHEHFVPKSRAPKCIWNDPRNIFWAHRLLNTLKANLLPCEWEQEKTHLALYALIYWNIKREDKRFLEKTLEHWDTWHKNPCELCLLKCKEKQK